LVAVGAVLGGLVVADHLGWLGLHEGTDYERYHGQTLRCVKVVDGDTLDVDLRDGRWPHTRIRLWGVDTPETKKPDTPVQHFGPEASRFTRELCLGRDLRLELLPRDTRGNFGRLLAYVYLPDGRMLNRMLVAEGYAYADPRFDHRYRDEFRALMKQARDAGRGLWAEVTPEDLPYYLRD
jgi:micrococcal nuclease